LPLLWVVGYVLFNIATWHIYAVDAAFSATAGSTTGTGF
jgi:hypothetical protein